MSGSANDGYRFFRACTRNNHAMRLEPSMNVVGYLCLMVYRLLRHSAWKRSARILVAEVFPAAVHLRERRGRRSLGSGISNFAVSLRFCLSHPLRSTARVHVCAILWDSLLHDAGICSTCRTERCGQELESISVGQHSRRLRATMSNGTYSGMPLIRASSSHRIAQTDGPIS